MSGFTDVVAVFRNEMPAVFDMSANTIAVYSNLLVCNSGFTYAIAMFGNAMLDICLSRTMTNIRSPGLFEPLWPTVIASDGSTSSKMSLPGFVGHFCS